MVLRPEHGALGMVRDTSLLQSPESPTTYRCAALLLYAVRCVRCEVEAANLQVRTALRHSQRYRVLRL